MLLSVILGKSAGAPYSPVAEGRSTSKMALFWRLWAAVTLVNFAVLAVFVGLATLQFGEVHEKLVGERLTVLADRAAAPLEAAASIGLPLSVVRTADALLERARQSDEAISAIHVFDSDGTIIRSTSADPPPAIMPEAVKARAVAGGRPWYVETPGAFLGGVDIRGLGGKAAGGVLVVYPGDESVTRILAMAAELALYAVAVLAIAAALGGALLRLGLAPQIRLFDEIDSAIARSERDSWRHAAGRPLSSTADHGVGGLRDLLDQADARYLAAGYEISDPAGGEDA